MSRVRIRGLNHNTVFFRYAKRITLMCVILMMTLGLYGCGTKKIDVSTVMTIEQDGSGSREISMEFKKEDFQKLFPGTSWEKMVEIVTDRCPKEFGFGNSAKEDSYKCVFHMDFESMEDYQKQVQKIVGDAAVVRYEAPRDVFASGMYFEENFTSLAMLDWLYELLEEQGAVEKGGGEALFKVGDVSLVDNGKTVKLDSDPICYDMRISNPVERIDILTHYLANKRCDRQVIITFNKEAANTYRSQLESWFTRQLPQEVTGVWAAEGEPVFIISGTNMIGTSVDRLMQSVLSERDGFVSSHSQPQSHIFDSVCNWEERINLEGLISGEDGKIRLGYYVLGEDGMEISVQRQNADKVIKLENSDVYPGYQKVLEADLQEVNLVTSVTATYVVSRLEIETRVEDKKNVSRNIDLYFQSEPDAKDMEHIISGISKKCEKYADVTKKVSEEGSFIALRIAQTGTVDFLNDGFTQIFGMPGQLQYAVNGKFIELKHDSTFEDILDFTKFLENDPGQTHMTYHLIYPSGSRIDAAKVASNVGAGNETIGKNEYIAEIDGAYLSLTMEGTVPNKRGRMLLGILIAALILIPIIIILVNAVRRVTKRTVGKVTSTFKKFDDSFGPKDQEVLGYDDMKEDTDIKRPGAGKRTGTEQMGTAEKQSPIKKLFGAGKKPAAGTQSESGKISETGKKTEAGKSFEAERDSQSGYQQRKEAAQNADKTQQKGKPQKASGKNPLKMLFGRKKAPEVPYEEDKFEADATEAGAGTSAAWTANPAGKNSWSSHMPEAEGFSEVAAPAENTDYEDVSEGYVSFEDWKESGKTKKAGNVYDMNYSNAPWRGKSSPVGTLDGSINESVDSSDDDL